MNERLSVAIPCRANEPDLGVTLASLAVACRHALLPPGLVAELLICINGGSPGTTDVPLVAVRDFCARYQVSLEERWLALETRRRNGGNGETGKRGNGGDKNFPLPVADSPILPFSHSSSPTAPFPRCTVLLTERRGKPPAWNNLWQWAHGTLVLFADADVQVDPEAVYHLWARFQHEPHLQLVAAREVPVLQDGGTVWSRMGAIPYRFNFGNAGGRLLLLRKEALPDGMPEDLLLEDAWLTVAVGRQRVAKEIQARVFFLLPATGHDYFAERVRTEGGKLQIRRFYKELLAAGPIAQYRWPEFWREIRMTEYPLVILAFVVRLIARLWARLSLTHKDFYALYRPFPSTKGWESPLR
jgi:glycosyltransferase involved in cell wall biosynthesis